MNRSIEDYIQKNLEKTGVWIIFLNKTTRAVLSTEWPMSYAINVNRSPQ